MQTFLHNAPMAGEIAPRRKCEKNRLAAEDELAKKKHIILICFSITATCHYSKVIWPLVIGHAMNRTEHAGISKDAFQHTGLFAALGMKNGTHGKP